MHHMNCHLILTATQGDKYCYSLHFKDEEIQAKKAKWLSPGRVMRLEYDKGKVLKLWFGDPWRYLWPFEGVHEVKTTL